MLNWKSSSLGARCRFIVWFCISIILMVYFVRLLIIGLPLNTNVMDLLPDSGSSEIVQVASKNFSSTMGNQVVFLVGNSSESQAINSADLFYKVLSESNQFKKITYKVDSSEQSAWASFYFPYRMNLLTKNQRMLLLKGDAAQVEQAALMNFYSPMGITNSELMQKDPFYIFQKYITTLKRPASKVNLKNNRLMVKSAGTWYIMLSGDLKGDSFSISTQKKVIGVINKSISIVEGKYINTKFIKTGMIFYAKAGSDNAQHDISTIGLGSLVGIILLMLLTFRSISPLLLTIFSSVIGFIAAFAITNLLFGSVYLFTLVFGASLIGISVDYSFFYYADRLVSGKSWTPMLGLRNIIFGVFLGLVNIILAYIIIAWAPFPGIRQLAVFAIVGLTMAFSTVVCCFPMILKAQLYSFTPLTFKWTNKYLDIWRNISLIKIFLIYFMLFIISMVGLLSLHTNDDIRILEKVPKALKINEMKLKSIIGSEIGASFIVVSANSSQGVLAKESKVIAAINKEFINKPNSSISLSSYLPTVQQQKDNYVLIKNKLIIPRLHKYLLSIGVKASDAIKIAAQIDAIKFRPLLIKDWIESPVSKSLKFLWLGEIKTPNGEKKYATVILLSDKLNKLKIQKICSLYQGVSYINKANEVSHIFETYRLKISGLLIVVFALLFIFLFMRYGLRKAFLYFLPPSTSCILSISTLGLLGIPLTLFNILAIVLILGISVDYILFFAETKSSYQATMLAVSLSAITTILAFGLLALSNTPVIHYFGVTIFIGICSSFLLSPMVLRFKEI